MAPTNSRTPQTSAPSVSSARCPGRSRRGAAWTCMTWAPCARLVLVLLLLGLCGVEGRHGARLLDDLARGVAGADPVAEPLDLAVRALGRQDEPGVARQGVLEALDRARRRRDPVER